MNTPSATRSSPFAWRPPAFARDAVGRGVFAGLVPLGLLLTGIAGTLLVSVLTLSLTESVAFATRQTLMLAIAVVGLLATVVIYGAACVRLLRQIQRWQREGASKEAAAALWMLVLSALVALSPLVVAALVPHSGP
jgi:hypothetical protein